MKQKSKRKDVNIMKKKGKTNKTDNPLVRLIRKKEKDSNYQI